MERENHHIHPVKGNVHIPAGKEQAVQYDMTDGSQGHMVAREGSDVTSDHLDELSECIHQHKGEGRTQDNIVYK